MRYKLKSVEKEPVLLGDKNIVVDELLQLYNGILEEVFENMSDAVVVFDKHGKLFNCNKTAKEIFLLNTEDWNCMESKFEQEEFMTSGESFIKVGNSTFQRILNGEKLSRRRIDLKIKGTVIHIECSSKPIYDKEGSIIGGIIIARDITDRINYEENLMLKAQCDLLNSLTEGFDLGLARYSYPEFEVLDFNRMAYSIIKGINPDVIDISSVKGRKLRDLTFDEQIDKLAEGIQGAIEEKKDSHVVYGEVNIDGEGRYFKVIYQPIYGLNSQVLEVAALALDITEEIKIMSKMEETIKMQEEVFANVSHELKTPLNVIFSTSQLMELYLKNSSINPFREKISNNLNIIKQNCYRFTKLINNIIDLSKIESGFFRIVLTNENIVEVIEDIVQSVSDYVKGRGLNIVFDTDTEEKIIACDPEKIERIILNLISNAMKFTDPEGTIFVNVSDKGDAVEITVRDTGIGIDSKHLDNIFRRFHQINKSLSRNAEGSGIGLSLVRSIVELHGGKITVESEVGIGTAFIIKLPVEIVENPVIDQQNKPVNSKVETISIEFSDIYSVS